MLTHKERYRYMRDEDPVAALRASNDQQHIDAVIVGSLTCVMDRISARTKQLCMYAKDAHNTEFANIFQHTHRPCALAIPSHYWDDPDFHMRVYITDNATQSSWLIDEDHYTTGTKNGTYCAVHVDLASIEHPDLNGEPLGYGTWVCVVACFSYEK